MNENIIIRAAYSYYKHEWYQDEYNRQAEAYGIEHPLSYNQFKNTMYNDEDTTKRLIEEYCYNDNMEGYESRVEHYMFYYKLYKTRRLVSEVCGG